MSKAHNAPHNVYRPRFSVPDSAIHALRALLGSTHAHRSDIDVRNALDEAVGLAMSKGYVKGQTHRDTGQPQAVVDISEFIGVEANAIVADNRFKSTTSPHDKAIIHVFANRQLKSTPFTTPLRDALPGALVTRLRETIPASPAVETWVIRHEREGSVIYSEVQPDDVRSFVNRLGPKNTDAIRAFRPVKLKLEITFDD